MSRHYQSRRRAPFILAAIITACGTAGGALAQDETPPRQPESVSPGVEFDGRPVRRVEIVRPVEVDGEVLFEALSGLAADFAGNQIRTRAGEAYLQETVSQDVGRLSRTGRYRTVNAGVQQLDDGSVVLVFTLVQQPIIEAVQSVGNYQLTDQDIYDVVGILDGTPVDLFQLDRAARRIEDLYNEKGYYNAQVDWDRRELEDNSIAVFRITEGEKLRVTSIRFEGVEAIRVGEVRRQIKTKEAFLFLKAPLDDDQLDEDVASIYTFYRDRGYLDVRVDRRVQPAPNNREAALTFFVDEGPLYHLGEVFIETVEESESARFAPEQLAPLLPMRRGDVFAINTLRQSVDRIEEAYHKQGYADVVVTTDELRRTEQPVVDLVVRIEQRERYVTGEVLTRGNIFTRSTEILGPMNDADVRPGVPLNPTAIEVGETEVLRKNIFDRVYEPPRATLQTQRSPETDSRLDSSPAGVRTTIQSADPYDPMYRDVIVEVKETDTGEFNVGAAFNTDSGVVGRIEIVQRNFDVYDTPDTFNDLVSGQSFRGGAQTLKLEVLPGTRVQTYSLSLSDNALFDTDYSGSGSVYYRNRVYDEYDEQRLGGRVAVGRRFGTRWVGNTFLRLESVELDSVEPDQPVDVFAVADQNNLAGVGFSLARTTINDRFRPTRGARTEVSLEQVGGDFTFTKVGVEHQFFVPILEDFLGRTTVFSTKIAADYIPQPQDDVPVYERFYLGGQSFRGFEYRGIGPVGIRNDTGELGTDPVGGTWSFFLGSEISRPIFEELISGVVFVDTGTVSDGIGFDDYRVSAGFGIRLYVPQISPAPIGFDFGFPLIDEPTDESRFFTFFIDIPF